MPRFFIDTSDQDCFVIDREGQILEDLEAAKDAAVKALPEMARDTLPDGDDRTFLAIVRGEDGRRLLEATLVLTVMAMPDIDG